MICHSPADDSATARIEHNGEIEEARPRRDVRDVSNPKLVWLLCSEIPVDEIWRGSRIGIANGRRGELTARSPVNAAFAHQASDAPAGDSKAGFAKIRVNTWAPVGRSRSSERSFDPIAKRDVSNAMRTWRSAKPRVKAAYAYVEKLAHNRDRVVGLVGSHESEDFSGIALVSRANQAAAFDSISASSLRRLFSRRSRVSS